MYKQSVDKFVHNYQYLTLEIEYLRGLLDDLEALKYAPKTSKIGLQYEIRGKGGTDSGACYERTIEQIERLQERLALRVAEFVLIIDEFENNLQKLDLIERAILRRKLIKNKTFSQISRELFLSERTVYRKYSGAVVQMFKVQK